QALSGAEARAMTAGTDGALQTLPLGDVIRGEAGGRTVFLAQVSTGDLLVTDDPIPETLKTLPAADAQKLFSGPPTGAAQAPLGTATRAGEGGLDSGVSRSPAPRASQQRPPAQSTAPPPNPAAAEVTYPESDAANPESDATEQPIAGFALTSPKVVTAATVQALVRAERAGIERLQMELLGSGRGGLSDMDAFTAFGEGLARVAPHLRRLDELEIVLPEDRYLDPFQVRVSSEASLPEILLIPLSTPLPFPGGSAFARPEIGGDSESISGAFGVVAPLTLAPALAFFALLFSVLSRLGERQGESPGRLLWRAVTAAGRSSEKENRRRIVFEAEQKSFRFEAEDETFLEDVPSEADQSRESGEPYGFAGSLGLWLLVSGLFYLFQQLFLSRLWIWIPDSPVTTAPGTTASTVVLAGGLAWGLVVATRRARQAEALRHPEELERDPLLRTALFRDTPITDISQNRLGFGPLVEAFRRFLDNAHTEPPVIVAVNGPWGSGKSSLMSMVSSELEKTRRFHTVWFNAWRYQKEEQAMAAFLQAVARQLSSDWGVWRGVRIAWVRFRGLGFWKMLLLFAPLAALLAGWRAGIDPSELFAGLVKATDDSAVLELAGALVAVAGGLLGIRGVPWLASLFQPFRLRFEKLFQTTDYSARVGFLDEFGREFQLYRQAAGRRKLLVVVDDLDRCSPEHVVDVLKAINLIVTSDTGAGKTFFLLGFDRAYVRRAIEQRFAKFAEGDPGFPDQYLKKMITLGVSVPTASDTEIERLLAGVDGAGSPPEAADAGSENGEKHPLLDRLTLHLRRLPAWGGRLTAVLGLLAVLVLLTPSPEPPPDPEAATSPAAVVEQAAPASGGEIRAVVSTRDASPLPQESSPWWYWLLVLAAVVAALVGPLRERPVAAEVRYRREEDDSHEFLDAIRQCAPLLPRNPRDAIRLVNRLRMGWLVQSGRVLGGGPDPLPGRPLSEKEYILLGAFFERFPGLLEMGRTQGIQYAISKGIERLDRDGTETPEAEAERRRLADIDALLEILGSGAVDLAALADGKLIERYISVNRHLLSDPSADGGE
ncbi:MAG: KAP family NTPase, partial [Holophagales bacterium]|nr:KAP family NTPase [Holophagales bacterium]